MAELIRKRYNGVDSVTLGAAISSSGATSITFAAALQSMGANIATLAADEFLPLVIDNEIIYLTAYTAAATTGTISRGKEGTTAATHSNGASVVHGPTVADVDRPATPEDPWLPGSSYDYEFSANDTTSLPSGWSWVNQQTATYRERRGVGELVKPENGAGPRPLGGIARNLPTESTWAAYAKVQMNMWGGGNLLAGLSLRESSTAKTYNWFKRLGSTQSGVDWLYFSTATGLSTETGVIGTGFETTFYCGIRCNSSTSYDGMISHDGSNWRAGVTGLNPGFTPDQIGLLGWSENGYPMLLSWHWFRVEL